MPHPRSLLIALFAACLLLPAPARAAEKTFGFSGMEFYKLDWATQNLRIADVNGDGLNDIVVVNNARARVECLIQRAQPLPKAEAQDPAEPNEIFSDTRFESRPFLSEKRIFSMELGDLNGDGRTDMAYYGDPRELVVVYQDENGQWGKRRSFDIADGSTQQAGVAIGDLNGDGRNDLVLLGSDGTYFMYQNAQGNLEAPVKEAGLPDGAIALVIEDFNGDKRPDLLYICSNDVAPFCFRFQTPTGKLGPEIRCRAPAIRGVGVGDADGDGADELIAIQMAQGRLVVYKTVTEPAGAALLDGPFERYALRGTASRKPHALAFGPFSDPKRQDILVTDPDAAEVELFAQTRPGLWNRQGSFPSLQGVTDLTVLPAGDGKPQLLVLSPDEPMLGLAQMDAKGRLTFPRSLPTVGRPTAMAAGDLDGDGKPEIIYASTQERDRSLRILGLGADGQWQERQRLPLEDVRSDPDGLMIADANQDGKPDILLFIPYQEMRVLKATGDGKFVDASRGADYGKGLVQGARLKSTALVDVNQDGKAEILVASKNFARALRLDAKDRLEVVDQFNGRSPTSQIVGVTGADLDGDGAPEIVLVDSANRCLTVLKRGATGAYEIVENLATGGPISFERIAAADLTGSGKPALVLLGQNDFTLLQPGMPRVALREIASYETSIRNGRLDNVAVGDLDGDGRPEFVVTEGTKEILEVLTRQENSQRLRRALGWPIFEARTFGNRPGPGGAAPVSEPREYEIGDVTHDGKPDIVLLIHDRLLVYVQE